MKLNHLIYKFFLVFLLSLTTVQVGAQRKKNSTTSAPKGPVSIGQIQKLISQNRFSEASLQLYRLTRSQQVDRNQVKYLLGLTLMEQSYYQLAAIQFVDVIRQGNTRYLRPALDKLSLAADELGDETLLNYALKRIEPSQFPGSRVDTLYYRLGENAYLKGNLSQAEQNFRKVASNSRYYFQSQYQLFTLYLEMKRVDEALQVARRMSQVAKNNNDKVLVNLAIARGFYQKQDWENAIRAYRTVPKDSPYWSDSLFELSWAQLRSARFRSVLGTLQTLHSPYYEEEYMPESLIVRGIVYLYICKFDELEKTMTLFGSLYGQYANQMDRFYRSHGRRSKSYALELVKTDEVRRGKRNSTELELPYPVMRSILKEGDIQRTLKYQQKISNEIARLEQDSSLGTGVFLTYGKRVLNQRLNNSRLGIADMIRSHLRIKMREWKDLEEQAGFLNYELINGRKENLKKKIAGKEVTSEDIDNDRNRDFYVENGFEYWPVTGEVWLNELGHYHYLGQQSCN